MTTTLYSGISFLLMSDAARQANQCSDWCKRWNQKSRCRQYRASEKPSDTHLINSSHRDSKLLSPRWSLQASKAISTQPVLTQFQLNSPQLSPWEGEWAFRKWVLSENSTDVRKSNNHHRDSHHNEAKTQGYLIQLVIAIRHGFFTIQSFLSNSHLQTSQHVRLTTNLPSELGALLACNSSSHCTIWSCEGRPQQIKQGRAKGPSPTDAQKSVSRGARAEWINDQTRTLSYQAKHHSSGIFGLSASREAADPLRRIRNQWWLLIPRSSEMKLQLNQWNGKETHIDLRTNPQSMNKQKQQGRNDSN